MDVKYDTERTIQGVCIYNSNVKQCQYTPNVLSAYDVHSTNHSQLVHIYLENRTAQRHSSKFSLTNSNVCRQREKLPCVAVAVALHNDSTTSNRIELETSWQCLTNVKESITKPQNNAISIFYRIYTAVL